MATTAPPKPKTGSRPVSTPRRAPWPVTFFRSDIGKKYVMAITGLMLLGFVLFHMVGNLKLYMGPEDINHYGEFLRDLLVPLFPRTVTLWALRLGLIAAFVLHIVSAASLTRSNAVANSKYRSKRDYVAADFAGRTMRWTGVIVALFLLFHLMDLTWGNANPDYIRGDIYHNVVESFSRPPVAVVYIVANLALALHIYHGAWSMFQSLGINSPKYNAARRGFAITFAVVIAIGNISFPVAVLTGVIS